MKLKANKYGLLVLPVFLVLLIFQSSLIAQNNFNGLREQMVIRQIQARGITDKKILDAFRNVERHKFVLPEYIQHAYRDSPLAIIENQTTFVLSFIIIISKQVLRFVWVKNSNY